MSDVVGAGVVVLLLALFFAIVVALAFGVAICRGALAERRRSRI